MLFRSEFVRTTSLLSFLNSSRMTGPKISMSDYQPVAYALLQVSHVTFSIMGYTSTFLRSSLPENGMTTRFTGTVRRPGLCSVVVELLQLVRTPRQTFFPQLGLPFFSFSLCCCASSYTLSHVCISLRFMVNSVRLVARIRIWPA